MKIYVVSRDEEGLIVDCLEGKEHGNQIWFEERVEGFNFKTRIKESDERIKYSEKEAIEYFIEKSKEEFSRLEMRMDEVKINLEEAEKLLATCSHM